MRNDGSLSLGEARIHSVLQTVLVVFWSSGCVNVALSCNLISTYSAVKNTIILLMIKRQRESPVVAHPTWGFPRATQASVNRPDDDYDDDNGDDQPT